MAISSVRENVTPTLSWNCVGKMLLFIIFYINFMFILFPSFQALILFLLYFMSFYIYTLFHFEQQILLLFILLVFDRDQLLFVLYFAF